MRLADVDPRAVAAAAVRTVLDHLHRQAMRLDPTWILAVPEHAGALGLRPTVEALALYAQRGLPVWDWTDHGMAADGLLDVVAALYATAADDLRGVETPLDVADDLDPGDDALALVVVAAGARVRLDRHEPLSARELAVLGGITAHGVRDLMRRGELPATAERPARVHPMDARRWLAARGVPGIAEQRHPPGRGR